MKRICLGCCISLLVFSLHAGERAVSNQTSSYPEKVTDPSLLPVKETATAEAPVVQVVPAPEVKATPVPVVPLSSTETTPASHRGDTSVSPLIPVKRALAPSYPRAEVLVVSSSPETPASRADSLKVTPREESGLPPEVKPKAGNTARGGVVVAIDEDTSAGSDKSKEKLPPNSVNLVPGWAE